MTFPLGSILLVFDYQIKSIIKIIKITVETFHLHRITHLGDAQYRRACFSAVTVCTVGAFKTFAINNSKVFVAKCVGAGH